MRVSCRFTQWLVIVVSFLSMSACGRQNPVVTPPTISVQITRDSCPSIEVQEGMQIAWTNMDTVDRVLFIQRMNDQGVLVDAGGTELLRPGDTFSTLFEQAGQYAYYCSEDRASFGTIIVLPGSYPYP